MNISAYGLYPISATETPYGNRVLSVDSIREAITAIPEDERDAWYLPDSERNFAYWGGGRINYHFTNDLGDAHPAFYCGKCAEHRILNGNEPRPYLTSTMYSSGDPDICDDCGKEISN